MLTPINNAVEPTASSQVSDVQSSTTAPAQSESRLAGLSMQSRSSQSALSSGLQTLFSPKNMPGVARAEVPMLPDTGKTSASVSSFWMNTATNSAVVATAGLAAIVARREMLTTSYVPSWVVGPFSPLPDRPKGGGSSENKELKKKRAFRVQPVSFGEFLEDEDASELFHRDPRWSGWKRSRPKE